MKHFVGILWCISAFLSLTTVQAQTKEAGPVISEYGKVYKVENPDIKVDTTKTYKLVFDIMNSPDDPSIRNASIETAARFLNMHAQSGVPVDQLHVMLVVHNKASKDLANSKVYEEKYGVVNPNEGLINALLEANVQIVFCGQSAASRGFPKEKLIPQVQLALSAMTALSQAQEDGYQLIKF